jgi:hypothetical protein
MSAFRSFQPFVVAESTSTPFAFVSSTAASP